MARSCLRIPVARRQRPGLNVQRRGQLERGGGQASHPSWPSPGPGADLPVQSLWVQRAVIPALAGLRGTLPAPHAAQRGLPEMNVFLKASSQRTGVGTRLRRSLPFLGSTPLGPCIPAFVCTPVHPHQLSPPAHLSLTPCSTPMVQLLSRSLSSLTLHLEESTEEKSRERPPRVPPAVTSRTGPPSPA